MDASDVDRVSRASLGDSSASRQLAVQHGRLVLGLCVHLAHDPEQAFRAVWRQVFADLSAWDPHTPLDQWIATVAHRQFLGTAGRAAAGAVVQFGERGPRARAPGPVAIDAAGVERAVSMLPVERRRMLVLRHLACLPAARIAATEGTTVGAVEAHVHRGRAFVARRLADDRPPWEELSALLDGALPPEERAELEERVVGDPDLARACKDLRAVMTALDDLERPEVPTALLDDVAALPTRDLVPKPVAWPWLVAVVVALLMVPLALRPTPVVQASLDAGAADLQGHVRVTARGNVVELDGHARVAVDDAGAVTVHLYDGRASVTGHDGRRITVPRGRDVTAAPPVSDATSGAP